jgi:hypothetical protein
MTGETREVVAGLWAGPLGGGNSREKASDGMARREGGSSGHPSLQSHHAGGCAGCERYSDVAHRCCGVQHWAIPVHGPPRPRHAQAPAPRWLSPPNRRRLSVCRGEPLCFDAKRRHKPTGNSFAMAETLLRIPPDFFKWPILEDWPMVSVAHRERTVTGAATGSPTGRRSTPNENPMAISPNRFDANLP